MSARDIAYALAGLRAQQLADGGCSIACPVPAHGKGSGTNHPGSHIGDNFETSRWSRADQKDQYDRVVAHIRESQSRSHFSSESSYTTATPSWHA
jgi:hypothetical protein